MTTATSEKAQEFVDFCRNYITGDEKSQAQVFLDRFFQIFNHKGALEAGATFEERISKSSKTGNMGYADLLWKNHVLIEMKKRGSDLVDRDYRTQAERYYIRIPKKDRPRYVILCNFDQFDIYDFDNQPDEPVDSIPLEKLPQRLPAFTFMESEVLKPIFTNNQVEITEKIAKCLGELLHLLLQRGESNNYEKYSPLQAQRFVLQCVLAMYAEDIGLLPPDIFTRCVKECVEEKLNSYDVIEGLFKAMNEQGITPDRKYEGVKYFNGGLFQEIHPIRLEHGELFLLLSCAEQDWSKVRPSIFGNLFEGALKYTDKSKEKTKKQRHAHGIHFTSEGDIRSIVLPTIRDYWEKRIEETNTTDELASLHEELVNYTILDPACGSGNFLYVAYQELKYIEKVLLEKIKHLTLISSSQGEGINNTKNNSNSNAPSPSEIKELESKNNPNAPSPSGIKRLESKNNPNSPSPSGMRGLGGEGKKVSPKQFHGMDINPFALELAKVTLMIGRKVAIDKLGLDEDSLPLDQLDDNILCRDALLTDWVKADAIIGNPPFLGGKKLRSSLGDEYADKIKSIFPDVQGQPDFCVFWFRKAIDNLAENGRCGLVGTNSISQMTGRKASLDYVIAKGGIIHHAISTQPWSGEANVHVSIINWCKTQPDKFILDGVQVKSISASLKMELDVNFAIPLLINKNISFQACELAGKGFIIDEDTAQEWIKKDTKNQDVLKMMVDGKGLINPFEKKKWVIDFNDISLEEASDYLLPFARVKEKVKPEREESREKSRRENWWSFSRTRPSMRKALQGLSCYFAIPKIAKYILFTPVDISILPCEANMVIASEDFYILGILTSKIHRLWVKAQSSTLKGDTRYTNTTCFETFPFPQNPDKKVVEKIRKTTLDLHEYRTKEMEKKGWGITQLYNHYFNEPASKLYQLHAKLDRLTLLAYNFQETDHLLKKLLQLNQEIAEKEKKGEKVIGCFDPYSQ